MNASNSLGVIFPYQREGVWMFDDENAGLQAEPFVSGAPEIIDRLVEQIPDARRGFALYFSRSPFPGYQAELEWVREEYGGNWYRWRATGMEGWLCPALLKYFPEAPPRIFCKAERAPRTETHVRRS
jgi:hypothetical protein